MAAHSKSILPFWWSLLLSLFLMTKAVIPAHIKLWYCVCFSFKSTFLCKYSELKKCVCPSFWSSIFLFWSNHKLYRTEHVPKRNIELLAAFFFSHLLMHLAEGDIQYNPAEWLDFTVCKTLMSLSALVPACFNVWETGWTLMFLWHLRPITQNMYKSLSLLCTRIKDWSFICVCIHH